MIATLLKVTACVLMLTRTTCGDEADLKFPTGFSIGTAGAAYQIEGGWNASGKGVNHWDWLTHTFPNVVVDGSNGDIACDSYHKYKEDIRLVKELGLDHYRFSFSWSRILPTGFINNINYEGIQYYKNLLDELKANDIEPYVTLYHWDHPQTIADLGGWTNELIVDWFTDYAKVIFQELGSKFKFITTINEPASFCDMDTNAGIVDPALNRISRYLCGHNVLKAHASVYHLYDKEFRSEQKGQIGIIIPCGGYLPKDPSKERDVFAAEIQYQFDCGWIANPIYVGDYPDVMKARIRDYSRHQGFTTSYLPEFTDEWIEKIKGTADYYGLNYYTSSLVEPAANILDNESGTISSKDPNWPTTASSWLRPYPEGLGWVLRKIKRSYGNPPVYILENGISENGTTLRDAERITYYYQHLEQVLISIKNGCNVKSFTAWSLLDNFEWLRGYTERFGINYVDFTDPNRRRTPKLSSHWLKKVVAARQLLSLDVVSNITVPDPPPTWIQHNKIKSKNCRIRSDKK